MVRHLLVSGRRVVVGQAVASSVNRPKVEKEEFVCPTVWFAQENCEQSIYCCIGQNLLSSNTWVPTHTLTQMLNISIKKVYESAKFRRNWLI